MSTLSSAVNTLLHISPSPTAETNFQASDSGGSDTADNNNFQHYLNHGLTQSQAPVNASTTGALNNTAKRFEARPESKNNVTLGAAKNSGVSKVNTKNVSTTGDAGSPSLSVGKEQNASSPGDVKKSKTSGVNSTDTTNVLPSVQNQVIQIQQLVATITQDLNAAGTALTNADISSADSENIADLSGVAGLASSSLTPSSNAQALLIATDLQSALQQLEQNFQLSGTAIDNSSFATAGKTTDSTDALLLKIGADITQLTNLLSPDSSASSATGIASTLLDQLSQSVSVPATATHETPDPNAVKNSAGVLAQLTGSFNDLKARAQTLKTGSAFASATSAGNPQDALVNAALSTKQIDAEVNANSKPENTAAVTSSLTVFTARTPVELLNKTLPSLTNVSTDSSFISLSSIQEISHGNTSNSNTSDSNFTNQDQASSPFIVTAGTSQPVNNLNTSPSFSNELSKVSPSALLDQVTFQVKSTPVDGNSKISIQLDPAELGKVEIKLNVGSDGKTNVVVTADNRTTLDILERDSQSLTRALSDAGLSTSGGSLNFNLRGDGQNQRNASQNASNHKNSFIDREEENIYPVINTQNYAVSVSGSLDIKI